MIDQQRILDTIVGLKVSPRAKEEGAELVDGWLAAHAEADAQFKIRAIELGFLIELDPRTYVIGVQDLITEDTIGVFGNEWKTVKEPAKWQGKDSKYWNESVWLKEISSGPQIGIYALALHEGTYYERTRVPQVEDGKGDLPSPFVSYRFAVREPRIRVRAVVKSSPPRFWPTTPEEDGVYQFTEQALNDIRSAILLKAEQIRCARRAGHVPWQLTGHHCFPFNRECPLYADYCSQHVHPAALPASAKYALFDPSDPAAQLALPHIPEKKLFDPDVVILSASQYSLASECMEHYRVVAGNLGGKEESYALEVGTVLHAGVAEMYRMIREQQENGTAR